MCNQDQTTLFFTNATIGGVLSAMESRRVRLDDLKNTGFTNTYYANDYVFCSDQVESIDNNTFIAIDYNFDRRTHYFCDVSLKLNVAIDELQAKMNEIKSNLVKFNLDIDSFTITYIGRLRAATFRQNYVDRMNRHLSYVNSKLGRSTESAFATPVAPVSSAPISFTPFSPRAQPLSVNTNLANTTSEECGCEDTCPSPPTAKMGFQSPLLGQSFSNYPSPVRSFSSSTSTTSTTNTSGGFIGAVKDIFGFSSTSAKED
jgi:hypothetical protein